LSYAHLKVCLDTLVSSFLIMSGIIFSKTSILYRCYAYFVILFYQKNIVQKIRQKICQKLLGMALAYDNLFPFENCKNSLSEFLLPMIA